MNYMKEVEKRKNKPMMCRTLKYFVLFGVFFLPLSLLAQGSWFIQGKSIPELKKEKEQAVASPKLPLQSFSSLLIPSAMKQISSKTLLPLFQEARPQVPHVYSYEELGIFCKLDVQLEKKANFPIKFRLGEVSEVERLEGKY